MKKQFRWLIALYILTLHTVNADPISPEKSSSQVTASPKKNVLKTSETVHSPHDLLAALRSNDKEKSNSQLLDLDLESDLIVEKNPSILTEPIIAQKVQDTFDATAAYKNLFKFVAIGNLTDIEELYKSAKGRLNLNIKSQDRETPLSIAIHFHRHEIVRLLCALGANVNQHMTSFFPNYLLIAVHQNDIQTAQALLEAGIEKNGQTIVLEQTALHMAAEKGSLAMTELLLSHGILDLPDIFGQTAIFNAIKHGHLTVALRLAQQEGAMSHRNNANLTPIKFAYKNHYYVNSDLWALADENDCEIFTKKQEEPDLPKNKRRRPNQKTCKSVKFDSL